MTAAEFVDGLAQVTLTSGSNGTRTWRARCPAHDDSSPSLSISAGHDGAILLRCHAGCTAEDIVAKRGMTMRDLFPRSELLPARGVIAAYPYRDERGELLFEVQRKPPGADGKKKFVQRRPDGHGGWIWKTTGVRRVLYRLPELIAADASAQVFIPEGEKDVDNLRRLGLVATCNPEGAGKWGKVDEHARDVLAQRHVVILPDNDESGRKHAEQVAASLRAVAASVRVLDLPGLPNKGDVSDWIAAGGTTAQLLALVDTTAAEPDATSSCAPADHAEGSPGSSSAHRCTDLGNAERFAAQHAARIAFAVHRKSWMVYDGQRWTPDHLQEAQRLAAETARSILKEAGAEEDSERRARLAKHAVASESAARIRAMLEVAQPKLAQPASRFDADPWCLNVLNGTIDLRTMDLRPHRPADFLTKRAPVAFDLGATCPRFDAFLVRVLPDLNVREYVQRLVGYCLTAETNEHIMAILYGLGANGKSLLLSVLCAILGDYACTAEASTFLARNQDGPRNDLAALAGARLVSISEVESGRRLAEPLVKQATGGDAISARFLYGEFFEYRPSFKILMATNYKPIVRGTDEGIWRRLRLVPFEVTIPEAERDKDLSAKLLAESSGILNWALAGCLAWQRARGLRTPDAVKAAGAEYRAEQSPISAFIEERCVLHPDATTLASKLYGEYVKFAEGSSERPVPQRVFGEALRAHGCEQARTMYARLWKGIRPTGVHDAMTLHDAISGKSPEEDSLGKVSGNDTSRVMDGSGA